MAKSGAKLEHQAELEQLPVEVEDLMMVESKQSLPVQGEFAQMVFAREQLVRRRSSYSSTAEEGSSRASSRLIRKGPVDRSNSMTGQVGVGF